MLDFWVMWTYEANHSTAPIHVPADNAADAAARATYLFGENFRKAGRVTVFAAPPVLEIAGGQRAGACTTECLAEQVGRAAERYAFFFLRRPLACRACEGWGGHTVRNYPHAPDDFDTCPACTDKGLCALCAGPIDDEGTCVACAGIPGHAFLEGAPAPFDGCGCEELAGPPPAA